MKVTEWMSPSLVVRGRQSAWVIGNGWLKLDRSGPFSQDFDSWVKASKQRVVGHSLLHPKGVTRTNWDSSCVWLMEPASLFYRPHLIFYPVKYHLNIAVLFKQGLFNHPSVFCFVFPLPGLLQISNSYSLKFWPMLVFAMYLLFPVSERTLFTVCGFFQ